MKCLGKTVWKLKVTKEKSSFFHIWLIKMEGQIVPYNELFKYYLDIFSAIKAL
jgi:hypothetical protein